MLIDELARVDDWARAHPKEAAAVLTVRTGLDATTVDLAVERYSYEASTPTALQAPASWARPSEFSPMEKAA